jgi:hypothetical protein
MSNIKSNSDEYFDLLLEIIAMFGDNKRLIRSVLTIMADFFMIRGNLLVYLFGILNLIILIRPLRR